MTNQRKICSQCLVNEISERSTICATCRKRNDARRTRRDVLKQTRRARGRRNG